MRTYLSARAFIVTVLCITLIALGIVSCKKKPDQCEATVMKSIKSALQEDSSGTGVAPINRLLVFMDGSESMKGFVLEGGNNFTKLMSIIDVSPDPVSNDFEKVFFKFGNTAEGISREAFLRDTVDRDFYDLADTNITAAIDRLEREGQHSLGVIVTDLFQSDNDIVRLNERLIDVCHEYDWSVGVLAVRSDFQGWIYDIGPQQQNFSYGNPPAPRPFYLLVLGKYYYIQQFYDKLLYLSGLNASTVNFLIFTNNVYSSPITYPAQKMHNKGNIVKEGPYSESSAEYCYSYRLQNKKEKKTFFQQSFSVHYQPHVMHSSTVMPVSVRATRYDKNCAPVNDQGAADAVTVTSLSPAATDKAGKKKGENLVSLEVSVDRDALPPNSKYLFEIGVQPVFSNQSCPSWFHTWDMDISHASDEQFDGSTTYNLERSMRLLGTIFKARSYHIFFILKKGKA